MRQRTKVTGGVLVAGTALGLYGLFHNVNKKALKDSSERVEPKEYISDNEIWIKDTTLRMDDGLKLCLRLTGPKKGRKKGIIQIIHGMNEHLRRYQDLANFLARNGYVVVTSDNRGHGYSVNRKNPHGHMPNYERMIEDQLAITEYAKKEFPNIPMYMYGHSFGSLLARMYLQENDTEINKLLLSGTVSHFKMSKVGKKLAKIVNNIPYGKYKKAWLLQKLSQIGGDSDDWISNDEKVLEEIKEDPLWLETYDNSGIATIWETNYQLKQLEKFQCKNPNLPILSITGAEDIVTGKEKGLEDTKETLEKIGYKNVDIIDVPHMKHEVINELENQMIYDMILDFFDN